jgi:EAL domain-containing protein (putative c-di-GMP-specific phosphodiesterase class I)
MSYLKTLPLDIIKIDKSFIDEIPHDNNDLQITKAILALSHSLGYIVIAEGIEKQEQLETLQTMGCDIGQGYYFDKPLPADELISIYSNPNNS